MEVFAYCVVGLLIATLIFIIIAVVRNNFRRKRDKLYSRRMYVKINNNSHHDEGDNYLTASKCGFKPKKG